jgi:ABC-type oligopeptide transport system substrate-binding subunit
LGRHSAAKSGLQRPVFDLREGSSKCRALAWQATRQGLNYALDRKRFTDTVFKNIVRPLSLPWDSNSLAHEASKENFYTFDLDKGSRS